LFVKVSIRIIRVGWEWGFRYEIWKDIGQRRQNVFNLPYLVQMPEREGGETCTTVLTEEKRPSLEERKEGENFCAEHTRNTHSTWMG